MNSSSCNWLWWKCCHWWPWTLEYLGRCRKYRRTLRAEPLVFSCRKGTMHILMVSARRRGRAVLTSPIQVLRALPTCIFMGKKLCTNAPIAQKARPAVTRIMHSHASYMSKMLNSDSHGIDAQSSSSSSFFVLLLTIIIVIIIIMIMIMIISKDFQPGAGK